MKKYFIMLMIFACSSSFAKHYFNVCYYNGTKHPLGYNNGADAKSSNRVSKDSFKDRGTVVGEGDIPVGGNKCFQAADETIFLDHRLSFVVANQLYSIMNPAFRKPYVISQNATINSKGTIGNKVDSKGHEQYYLYVHVKDNSIVLSSSSDSNDASAYIAPAIK